MDNYLDWEWRLWHLTKESKQLYGFVRNDIILIAIDYCVLYLELWLLFHRIKFFSLNILFQNLLALVIMSSFPNTCGFYPILFSIKFLFALLQLHCLCSIRFYYGLEDLGRTKFLKNKHSPTLKFWKYNCSLYILNTFLLMEWKWISACLKDTLWPMNFFSSCTL